MALSASDIEEYLIRKTIDQGYVNPSLQDVARIKFVLDYTESVVNNYLEEQRDQESQSEYNEILALIASIKSEAGV